MFIVDSDRHVVEPAGWYDLYFEGLDVQGRKGYPTTGAFHPLWGNQPFSCNMKVPGGPDEQLRDMDLEGIDVAVLYPTDGLGIGRVPRPEAAVDFARRYNDWLAEACRTDPRRLKGVAMVAPQDPATAADEARRAVEELGFVGVMLPTWVPTMAPMSETLEPVYAAVEALGVPLAMHAAVPAQAMPRRFVDFLSEHTLGHTSEQMAAVCSIVVGGVLERHPGLTVAFKESGIGWVPYWMERLDEHYERLAGEVPYLTQKPSEYIRSGRCYFHAEADERSLPYAIQVMGDDCILWASDYPHWDSAYPDSIRPLRDRTDVSEESKRKILAENAARLYGIPVPEVAARPGPQGIGAA